MKLRRVQSMYTMTRMYKDRHMEKFKRVMRHIRLIRRLFWMTLKVHEVVQGAVHVHHEHLVPHVQGQAHGKVQVSH
jgi:hypothetical protein